MAVQNVVWVFAVKSLLQRPEKPRNRMGRVLDHGQLALEVAR